jgi:CO/xanthine dehydrogenase FAD-binding subunit
MRLTRAHTLEEALAARAAGATPLAGGTDAMVGWPRAAAAAAHVVDLWPVPELRGVRAEGGGARFGALTTCSDLLRLQQGVPGAVLLRAAAREFAAVQIRNRATLGGNLGTASPASDLAPVLLALGASIRMRGRSGARDVAASAFFTGYRRTACGADELIESIWIPGSASDERHAWRKVGTRAAQAIAKVALAVSARVDAGRVVKLRAAAGSVAEQPVLLPTLHALLGQQPTPALLDDVARRTACTDCRPIDDVRSTATYRRHVLARVLRTVLGELLLA